MVRLISAVLLATIAAVSAAAQTPQPFPRPGATAPPQPATAQPATRPAAQAPVAPAPPAATQAAPPPADGVPTAASLGIPIYPASQFLASYDAGRGQRYYIFGTTASFVDVTGYYRTQTGERGDLVFKDPPTHMFTGGTLGRYRDETMAFPPSVTVKDWTSGSQGYPNPKPGAEPARFPTIIMIVPAPPATPVR
jgi:hypothetical protein